MLNRRVVPALIAALAFSACGGDSGPSKEEFIEEADAVCAEGEQRAEELARSAFQDPENPTPNEVLAVVQDLVPIQRETIADVRELEMPEDDEDEINSILDQAEAATDQVAEIQDPQQALAAVQAADTPQDPFYESNQAAAEYGFDECSE